MSGFGNDKVIGWTFGLCMATGWIYSLNIALIFVPALWASLWNLIGLSFLIIACLSILVPGHSFMIFNGRLTEKLNLSEPEKKIWNTMRMMVGLAIPLTVATVIINM